MWKISKLYLKNFIHIYSGMGGKTEITLDLHDSDKKINIFVGKMGSGKSAILGHLQPFASYGSLDNRNQDKLIIPGETGIKKITFEKGADVYEIQHKYTWNESTNTHTTKSYITMNGIELNSNGNSTSFKELIKLEFGIDQSYLRVLRLGSNVSNLIHMKYSDRKSFLASLLKETELYTELYTKLVDENRTLNGLMKVVNSKLLTLSSSTKEELEIKLSIIQDDLKRIESAIGTQKREMNIKEGEILTLLSGNSVASSQMQLNSMNIDIDQHKQCRLELEDILRSTPSEEERNEISIEFGKIHMSLEQKIEQASDLSTKIEELSTRINILEEAIMLNDNIVQLESLRSSTAELEMTYNETKTKLNNFSCKYSYKFMVNFIAILNNFQSMMDYIIDNPVELVIKLYKSDYSIISWAKSKLNIARAVRINLHKKLANSGYAANYSSPIPLFRPPMCPTSSCPFIITHPEVLKFHTNGKLSNGVIDGISRKIDQLDKEISIYESCIDHYPKMEYLKKEWKTVSEVLITIGAHRETNLYKILSNIQDRILWYNYDRIVEVTGLCKLHEESQDIYHRYLASIDELRKLESTSTVTLERDLSIAKSEHRDLMVALNKAYDDRVQLEERSLAIKSKMDMISNNKDISIELTKLDSLLDNLEYDRSNLMESISRAIDKEIEIKNHRARIDILSDEFRVLSKEYMELNNKMQELINVQAEYDEYTKKHRMTKLLLEATSSKEGIPLVLIKGFLDECKDIINELIYDIFQDDVEILDFQISEDTNDFKIPFMSNGVVVDDISSASQGQQAIISIALSFAICRRSLFDYNILLLDEIDNSLYRHDREKFVNILFKQMISLGSRQVFLITHNDIFQQVGLPINIIMTTDEAIDNTDKQTIIKL